MSRLTSISGLGGMYGSSRKGFCTTGPTIRTTSGVCVPGASCVEERLFFAPFAWAKTLEKAPMPSSATKTPPRQRTEASKTRRLKKADFEVDFFFIDEVKFSLCGESETVVEMLGETTEECQYLF